jgi:hypothetical protein
MRWENFPISGARGQNEPGLDEVLSRLHPRELPTEVADRVCVIVAVRDCLDRWVEAVLMVASSLDLDETLRRIANVAMDLTGARYGALGVRAEDNALARLVGPDVPIDARCSGCQVGHVPSIARHSTTTPSLRTARTSGIEHMI